MIAQNRARPEHVGIADHDPPRQYANGPFQDAHVDIHFKAVYLLSVEERRDKRHQRRVIGTKQLFHIQ